MPTRLLSLLLIAACPLADADDAFDPDRVLIGATMVAVDEPWTLEGKRLRFPEPGLLLSDVTPGGPADVAGLRVNDVLTEIDGAAVRTIGELRDVVQHAAGRADVPIKFRRFRKSTRAASRSYGGFKPETGAITPITLCQLIALSTRTTQRIENDFATLRHADDPGVLGPTGIDLQVGLIDGVAVPSLTVRYNAESWLFLRTLYVFIDGAEHELPLAHLDTNRKVRRGGINEWDVISTAGDERSETVQRVVAACLAATEVKLVMIGEDTRREFDLAEGAVSRLRTVATAARCQGWDPDTMPMDQARAKDQSAALR
ncbi:MAG: PDZ domain-containing protein [Planctomycetota bacterium]